MGSVVYLKIRIKVKVDLGFHSFTSGTSLTQVLLGTSGLLLYAVPG